MYFGSVSPGVVGAGGPWPPFRAEGVAPPRPVVPGKLKSGCGATTPSAVSDYAEVAFLVTLLLYMIYSQWVGLDSRYPIGGALILLVVAAVADAAGATPVANTLAIYTFYLLAGGVVLLLVDHIREGRRGHAEEEPPSEEGPLADPSDARPDTGSAPSTPR